MNYANIKYNDIANGVGVRTCLFVSGCTHHCPNCFNQEAWDFGYGECFTDTVEKQLLQSLRPNYIAGITILGGEPFESENQRTLVSFLEKVRAEYPDKSIWCYTGYLYDVDLVSGGRVYTEVTERMLTCIDIMVDGRFVQALYDITLRFRGSSNQRIIEIQPSRKMGKVVLWEGSTRK